MMEIQRTMRLAKKPGAVDDVGHLALDDQRKHAGPVVRIVFEVGVLNDADITGGAGQAGSDGSAFASVALVKQHRKRNLGVMGRTVGGEFELAAGVQRQAAPATLRLAEVSSQPIRGSIARSVVDNDDLL